MSEEPIPKVPCLLRHPDAIAWEHWITTAGAATADPTTLGMNESMRVYLENRLARAFEAGVSHGRTLPNPGATR